MSDAIGKCLGAYGRLACAEDREEDLGAAHRKAVGTHVCPSSRAHPCRASAGTCAVRRESERTETQTEIELEVEANNEKEMPAKADYNASSDQHLGVAKMHTSSSDKRTNANLSCTSYQYRKIVFKCKNRLRNR